MKRQKYVYQRDSGSNYEPFHTHLLSQTDSYGIYMIRDDGSGNPRVLCKSTNEGLSWTTISTRSRDVTGWYYHQTDKRIWWCEPNTSVVRLHAYYIELDNSDNIVDAGYTTWGSGVTRCEWGDIWYHDDGGSNQRMYMTGIFRSDTVIALKGTFYWTSPSTWTQIGGAGWSSNDNAASKWHYSPVVVMNDTNYVWQSHYLYSGDSGNFILGLTRIKIVGGSESSVEYNVSSGSGDTRGLPPENMRGVSYNGSDILTFVVDWDGAADYRGYQRSISGASFTYLGTDFDIAVMLDRNSTSYEKAFHISLSKVYQITRKKYGLLFIDNPDLTGVIKAITDDYLFTEDESSNIEIWKYELVTDNDYAKIEVLYSTDELSRADIYSEQVFIKNLILFIYNDDDDLVFEGKIHKRTFNSTLVHYECNAVYDELYSTRITDNLSTVTTKNVKNIIEYILDTYGRILYYDSSIDANFTTTYSGIEFTDRTIKEILNVLLDLEDGNWYVAPDGKISAYKIANIPSSGKTVYKTSSTDSSNFRSVPVVTEIMAKFNQITLYGGIVGGVRLKNEEGFGEDLVDQYENGIKEYLDFFSHIKDQDTLNTLADSLLNLEGLGTNPYYVKVQLFGLGVVQYGLTLNLQFTPFEELATADDFYILEIVYDALNDIGYYILSTGLIQETRESDVDINKTADADDEQIATLASSAGFGNPATENLQMESYDITFTGGSFEYGQATPSGTSIMGWNGYFYATRVYNAVYNDIADFWKKASETLLISGICYSFTKKGLIITKKRADPTCVGICSDTFGFGLGVRKNGIPISIGGFVLAHVDKNYKMGTLLVPNKNGMLTKAKPKEIRKGLAKAQFLMKEVKTYLRRKEINIEVKNRFWVKII